MKVATPLLIMVYACSSPNSPCQAGEVNSLVDGSLAFGRRVIRALPQHLTASQFNRQHRAEGKAKGGGRSRGRRGPRAKKARNTIRLSENCCRRWFFLAALSVFISCRILFLSCCNSFCGPWAQGPRTQGPGTQRGHDETQEGKPQEGPRRAQGRARGGSQGRAQGGAQEGEPRRHQGGGRIESQKVCSLLHGCDTIEPCMSSHIR